MEKIVLKNVSKIYMIDEKPFYALKKVNFEIKKQEIIVVLGPSGSGKTTLLNLISGLDRVSEGNLYYDDVDITKFNDAKLTKHRQKKSGFIFQNYNLLEYLTVYQNVLVGSNVAQEKVDVSEIIKVVGMTKHQHKYMHQLSGGEQQRVSIARAIAKNPEVLFCDEPTGALDETTGKNVLDKLVDINQKMQTTIVLVTHNPGIAKIGDRIIKMNSGEITEVIKNKRIKPQDIEWA